MNPGERGERSIATAKPGSNPRASRVLHGQKKLRIAGRRLGTFEKSRSNQEDFSERV